MAFYLHRFSRHLSPLLNRTTHSNLLLLPALQTHSNPLTSQATSLNEHHVLNELSDLLQFPHEQPPLLNDSQTQLQKRIDDFLPPEEKLRGVFLQKLKGKFAIQQALSSVNVHVNSDVVSKVINKGNLGGEAIVTFFNWAIKQPGVKNDVGTFNLVIKALGRRKFFDFMERIVREMRDQGVAPNVETLSIVIDSFLRARRVNKAIETFKNVEDEFGLCCDTETLNAVLRCLCRRGHIGAGSSLLNKVRGKIGFSDVTYNVVLGGWSRFGRVIEMEKYLRDMLKDGFSPDCVTYSCIIEGLGRASRVEDAVEVFEGMKEKGCEPDVGVYNAMISNYVSVGDINESMKLYDGMLSSGCAPNVDTYTKLIGAFLKARKVADAIEMFDEMVSRVVPSTGTVTSFIEILCSYGPPYAAMTIYQNARKAGCTISQTTYKLLLMRLAEFGKCGMMLKVWDEMQECGYLCDVEVYEYVIDGLCNNGQLENAVLVMEEALHKGFCPSRRIYSKLNNKLMASNKVERAYKLFLKIKVARRHANARKYWRANGWHF